MVFGLLFVLDCCTSVSFGRGVMVVGLGLVVSWLLAVLLIVLVLRILLF